MDSKFLKGSLNYQEFKQFLSYSKYPPPLIKYQIVFLLSSSQKCSQHGEIIYIFEVVL